MIVMGLAVIPACRFGQVEERAISLRLDLDKAVYARSENIFAGLSIRNESEHDVVMIDPGDIGGGTIINLVDAEGRRIRSHISITRLKYDSITIGPHELRAEAHSLAFYQNDSIPLGGLLPGRYQLSVRLVSHPDVISNTVRFEVQNPDGADARAYKELIGLYSRFDAPEDIVRDMRLIVNRHRTSVYYGTLNYWFLAKLLHDRHNQEALEEAERYIHANPHSILSGAVATYYYMAAIQILEDQEVALRRKTMRELADSFRLLKLKLEGTRSATYLDQALKKFLQSQMFDYSY